MDWDNWLQNLVAWVLFAGILLMALVCWLVIILTFITLTRIAS